MSDRQEYLLERARVLAIACQRDGVKDSQLSQVLVHLKRHHSVVATRKLLEELPRSPFAFRSKSSRVQLENLQRHVGTELMGISDWQGAAEMVGWARRLLRWAETEAYGR